MPEQAGVLVGQPAAELDLDPVERAVAESLGEPAELLAERYEGRQRLHHLGPDGGDVDGGRDDAAGERRRDLLGGHDAGTVLGLGGGGAQVGVTTTSSRGEHRVLGEGLLGEDIERCAGDPARLEPVHQGVEVDQLARARS